MHIADVKQRQEDLQLAQHHQLVQVVQRNTLEKSIHEAT